MLILPYIITTLPHRRTFITRARVLPHYSFCLLSWAFWELAILRRKYRITGFVKRTKVGKLCSILGILDMTGGFDRPVLSKLFSLGLDMRDL